ncbi:MAG: DUF167 domain-containing protein [Bacteroidetes bacterium]|nr:DUF167 domain-containing protein [Bacteroidota bacterium]
MFIKIKVHPNSKKDVVVRKGSDSFEVFVRAKPTEGKANEATLDSLSEFLKVPRSRLRLIRGATARNKLVELSDCRGDLLSMKKG